MENDNYIVKMVNISKKFGAVQALKNIDFDIYPQEIVALLGDNGAGKSTLIKILTGVHPPDEGEIYFQGKKVDIPSPSSARSLGIETVYQDLSLIELMNISRNFFLGKEPLKKGFLKLLDVKKMEKDSQKSLAQIGIKVKDTGEMVSVLSGGERQAIAIGRAMFFGAKLLILDEPLTALSIREQRTINDRILAAREEGASIIFITHTIHHVYSIADRFIFLNKGVKVDERKKGEASLDEIEDIIAKEL
jgi:simple sugar transport system ATP-binding protein